MNKADTDFILKANNFAISKHLGQKDDEGKDYYLHHLVPVQTMIFMLTQDAEVISAAVLHDVLEDTETTYDELVENFGKRVADLVHEVTHEGKKDGYGFYFPRLHSKEAILIKLIDRANNISRMDSWDIARREHYLKRTKFWKDGKDRKNVC
jgi:(p)ppGpp synthase/HD superfamily hydrolase